MKAAWVRLALVCIGVTAAAVVAVGVGGAGNRVDAAEFSFDAVPGPARVTYGENIAYRATFSNIGGSTFTQVTFRMRYPYIESGAEPYKEASEPSVGRHTCPTTPKTVTLASGYHEWVCSFGQLKPRSASSTDPQLTVSVVWQAPLPNAPLTSSANCPTLDTEPGCLVSNGRWTIKEGVNDQSDPNDAYPPGGIPVRAKLLATGTTSQEDKEAGGYELSDACTDPLGQGSLRTKQAVTLANPVSTTVCLPTFQNDPNPNDGVPAKDLGLAVTIVEEAAAAPNAVHSLLGRSRICIADLGKNCGPEGSYPPFQFTIALPVKLVFRISSDAVAALHPTNKKITQVFHDGVALPMCPSTEQKGCYTAITETKGSNKFWVVEAQAPGNGLWGW